MALQPRAQPLAPGTASIYWFPGCEEYYRGARKLDVARSLNPELLSFGAWLAQNKNRIPLE